MTDWGSIKGLLFDKDGTLIDFFATWMPAYCAVADSIAEGASMPERADALLLAAGYDRGNDRLDAGSLLAGGTNEELIALWQGVLGDASPADIHQRVDLVFTEFATGEVRPTAEMPGLMQAMHERGYALGIATNDDTLTAHWTAEHLGIAHLMAFVIGADGGHGGKPGPGMGLAFCEKAKLEPPQVAMVGDSAADAKMARAAGFGAAIGVCTGAASAQELAPYFDTVIDSVADLPGLLWQNNSASGTIG
ncbi:MAG: HAD-IA family hydrolase [Alphaproteobacteria bacterium]|jgi:phosphoglycolate phosphatase|nr:HAD family hydrolase [Rhodospirillaceae bacterium]MDG2481516.1 HAD-IA family hydrolase [Alphaproteobacteria bacterium]MBT6202506.1 HAD family hydrolase [Rhodospirillaceae bacterium]MBT6511077.1 HAD family hydrolase [Rhodospirillaceae bacterium]MBT7614591.1 HAD family hydrolase [Rhodospirillaceae bacterium]